MTKALILCAGFGNRLGALTKDIPKCMLEVKGKPVLQHLVDHLNYYDIPNKDIIVNVHHKPEVIYDHFRESLHYYYEPKLLGEWETTFRIKNLTGGTLLVMNGDTLTDISINLLIQNARDRGNSIGVFDKHTYTGTEFIYKNQPVIMKQYDCSWIDIGTPENLEKARKTWNAI